MSSEIDSDLLSTLARHEGYRKHPYQDTVGKWTVGIGRNLDDVGISQKEAEYLLMNDVQIARDQLVKTYPWYQNLTLRRKQALINMVFNLGMPRFSGFRNMIAAIERKDYETAAQEALNSKWARQVGNRATELAEMLRTG